MFTNSLAEAQKLIRTTRDLAMVICGLYFDQARMHELLEFVRREFPKVPFLGVRMLQNESRRVSTRAAIAAAEVLGAVGFVDFVKISQDAGPGEAERHLRQAAFSHLRRPGE